jgi:hypothetical protein
MDAFRETKRTACLKLQNVSGVRGLTRSIFIEAVAELKQSRRFYKAIPGTSPPGTMERRIHPASGQTVCGAAG